MLGIQKQYGAGWVGGVGGETKVPGDPRGLLQELSLSVERALLILSSLDGYVFAHMILP